MTFRDKAAQRAANLRLAMVLVGIVFVFFVGVIVQHVLSG